MRTCIKCGKEEVKGKGMCGACYSKDWREKNPDKVHIYRKGYYEKNKEKIKDNCNEWRIKNPEKLRKYRRNYFKNYNKTDNRKNILKRYNLRNKEKNLSRNYTFSVIYGRRGYKPLDLPKEFFYCFKCGSNEKTEIHHEEYPKSKKDIIKAIEKKKIYCLCNNCHNKKHKRIFGKIYLDRKGDKNGK